MKLPISGLEVKLKDSLTRGEMRKYELRMFSGIKGDDAEKFAINAQIQMEAMVVLMVASADKAGEVVEVTMDYVLNMDVIDFAELHDECSKRYKEITTKKN